MDIASPSAPIMDQEPSLKSHSSTSSMPQPSPCRVRPLCTAALTKNGIKSTTCFEQRQIATVGQTRGRVAAPRCAKGGQGQSPCTKKLSEDLNRAKKAPDREEMPIG